MDYNLILALVNIVLQHTPNAKRTRYLEHGNKGGPIVGDMIDQETSLGLE